MWSVVAVELNQVDYYPPWIEEFQTLALILLLRGFLW